MPERRPDRWELPEVKALREMATDHNTKANKRKLRELAGVAYTRELGAELAKLETEFARWRSGEIDPFELSDRIHRFHDGVARDLYVLYDRLSPDHTVARAVALQLLKEVEVPSEILATLEGLLEFYGGRTSEPDEGNR